MINRDELITEDALRPFGFKEESGSRDGIWKDVPVNSRGAEWVSLHYHNGNLTLWVNNARVGLYISTIGQLCDWWKLTTGRELNAIQ